METGHFGNTPTTIANAILTGLSVLKLTASGGCCRSLARVADVTVDELKAGLTAGVPGILVFCPGGVYLPRGTTHGSFIERFTFSLMCCSGRSTNLVERLSDQELDPDVATDPGVEELQAWACYFAVRAIRGVTGLRKAIPKRFSQVFRLDASRYVGTVEIECEQTVDVWDDTLATLLETLGIVHSPTDPDDLWEADNMTPKSDWPATTDGGVTDL